MRAEAGLVDAVLAAAAVVDAGGVSTLAVRD